MSCRPRTADIQRVDAPLRCNGQAVRASRTSAPSSRATTARRSVRTTSLVARPASRPRRLRKRKEAVAAPPPSESKWRELRPRTPFSDPFQRSGGTVANIPHYGDWSSKAVNQQKGDGSSGGSTAKVRLDARAPMRREPAASFGASREPLRWLRSPLTAARRCFDGASPVAQ